MKGTAARLLALTGIGHTLVGLVLFRQPLRAILDDGIVNSIGQGQFDRGAAFWFLLFSPICLALAQIVSHAVARGDGRTLRIIGGYLLAMGVLGAAVMPISGFWILIAIAPLLLRTAGRVDPAVA